MSFNENVQSDSSRVRRSSGGGRAAGVGGGSILGVIALFLISHYTGIDLTSLLETGGSTTSTASSTAVDLSHCRTGADANAYTECRMVTTADSLDVVWETQLTEQQTGVPYELPGFEIFRRSVSTGCGNATSAVGPFYCPTDHTVYLDLDFFTQMERDYGAANAPLAQEYVVAHEWGHHIQNLTGVFAHHDTREAGPEGAGVRSELQADCYAGVWMHWASRTIDPESGTAFLKTPTSEEIAQALQTAQAIGDDRLQERFHGSTNPESWTHGSAEQRQKWLMKGLSDGSIGACDTFAVNSL